MDKVIKGALAALLAVGLAGCATHQQVVDNRLTLPQKLDAREGAFVVKLVGVQPLSAFNAKWKSVKLLDVRTGRRTELMDTAALGAGYSLFMGSLPEGEYQVTGLESIGAGPGTFGVIPALIIAGMTSDSQSLQKSLGTFRIQAGTLTNLGLIVSALPEEKGQPMKLAVMGDAAAQASALANVEPRARERLAAMPSTGWPAPPDGAAAQQAEKIVREHARNISTMEATPDGRILIGSALGMVHTRGTDGRWSSSSVGGLDNITYVRALADGRIFAATDAGSYFVGSPQQRQWTRHDFTSVDSRVTHLEPLGEHGFALLTASMHQPNFAQPATSRLYVKRTLEEAGPGREVLSLKDFSAMGRLPVFYNGVELQVYFNHVGVSRTADLYRIDPATLDKRMEKADFWATEIYRLSGQDVVMHRMNGMTIYSSFSSDGGRTWRHEKTGADPYSMRFVGTGRAYGFVVKGRGWSTNAMGMVVSTDGGAKWRDTGVPVEGEGLMPIRLVDGRLFVMTSRKLVSTADEGRTWTTEWPLRPEGSR
ncbi:MAG TPA: hypothetical protein VNB23_00815 [Ramlibacter sp.]|nr:hypothetical protein [Ramlibacter sp.]